MTSCVVYPKRFNITDNNNFKQGLWVINTDNQIEFLYFKDNLKTGKYFKYLNGKCMIKGCYHKDVMIGRWEYFTQEGKRHTLSVFKKDGSLKKIEKIDLKLF